MNQVTSKICVLGEFAVGKTSTVERFVKNEFSDKYLTTIGVKIDTKTLQFDEVELKFVIWDVAGTDEFSEVDYAYLRGASGFVVVADGTRRATVDAANRLWSQVEERYGALPFVYLINKSDLRGTWEVSEELIDSLRESNSDLYLTSAKTGEEVEEALVRLGELVVASEFSEV